MFAGWLAESGVTVLSGKIDSRDHLEKLAIWLNLPINIADTRLEISPASAFPSFDLTIPLDISSAAFLIAAAILCGQEIKLDNVLLNPTRLGFAHILQQAGVRFEMDIRSQFPEPIGSLSVLPQPGSIHEIFVPANIVPFCIDEIPILAALAVLLKVPFAAENIGELRYKESNRLELLAENLQRAGQNVKMTEDTLSVEPAKIRSSFSVKCGQDHRMMMSFALFSLKKYTVKGLDKKLCCISFPLFWEALKRF